MKTILEKMKAKGNNLCVGLDPYPEKIPSELQNARAMRYFCQNVIGAVSPFVGVVKMQSAFFEAQGSSGMHDLERVFGDARDFGLATILDFKRGDIPDTAFYYAKAGFDHYGADAVTIQPWMGDPCIRTFLDYARTRERGVFVVVAPTSVRHESWTQAQAMHTVYEMGLDNIQNGYSDLGAVVGASDPRLRQWRKEYPTVPFLVPGVGVQGGKIEDLAGIPGLIITASRSILYPEGDGYWKDNIVAACKDMAEKCRKPVDTPCVGVYNDNGRQVPA